MFVQSILVYAFPGYDKDFWSLSCRTENLTNFIFEDHFFLSYCYKLPGKRQQNIHVYIQDITEWQNPISNIPAGEYGGRGKDIVTIIFYCIARENRNVILNHGSRNWDLVGEKQKGSS